jgi:hypothetical protein
MNYLLADTLYEVLNEAIDNIALAVRADVNSPIFGVRLKMASRAVRCALELYGDKDCHGHVSHKF